MWRGTGAVFQLRLLLELPIRAHRARDGRVPLSNGYPDDPGSAGQDVLVVALE
jgi:hypothetical protein